MTSASDFPSTATELAGQAEQAIATVLAAERDARRAVEDAQAQAVQVAAAARRDARALAERSERRLRRVVQAFEAERARALAAIEADAALAAQLHQISTAERDALARAVRDLARRITGVAP